MVNLIARSALAGMVPFTVDGITMAESSHVISGRTFIEVTGDGALEALGLSIAARLDEGDTATRMADLRVFIAWRRAPTLWLRIGVERHSADYFWHWLKQKIEVGRASRSHPNNCT